MIMRKIYCSLIGVSIAISIVWGAGNAHEARAQVPFGGPIVWAEMCECSNNMIVFIGPPTSAPLSFQPGFTVQFMYYQMPWGVGSWSLGTYTPGGYCGKLSEGDCSSWKAQPIGTMNMVGTSL